MMDPIGITLLVICAVAPFAIAIASIRRRMPLEEPAYKLEGYEITAFPVWLHCGWQGALDVTEHVAAAARMERPTIMRSPPCGACSRRWEINLTTVAQKLRTGTLT